MRIRLPLFLAAGAAGYAAYRLAFRPWRVGWGVDPAEAGAPLAGDDLVPAPDHVETRGIDIDAPPDAVWPWLVQLGYGRGGWYSYDRIDMEGGSADSIRPELQHLALGDVVPTHPTGGLVVREIDPGRSLVLYLDDAMIDAQAKAAKALGAEATPANLRASGAFLTAASTPRFVATYALVVEARDSGSRLIERFRIGMENDGASRRFMTSLLGFGVFLMMRKQLLGIRDRAERLAHATDREIVAPAPAEPKPVAPTPTEEETAASEQVGPEPVAVG